MEFYLILGVATAVVSGLTVMMWHKTRCMAFPLGIAFMYFWTLYGGWRIVRSIDGTSDETPYLFYKVVPIFLNSDYMMALLLYTLFIIVVQVTVLYLVAPKERMRASRLIEISHWRVAVMAAAAAVVGYLLIRNTLAEGAEENLSGYGSVRSAALFTIYQVLDHAAMTLVTVGLAVCVSGCEPRYLGGKGNPRFVLLPYLAVFGALLYLCVKTGNRTEAALAFALLVLFYSANAQRASKLLIVGAGVFGAATITAVKLIRDGFFSAANSVGLADLWTAASNEVLRSTENVAAHLSMYGVLHKQLPLTYGSSFVSLLFSFVPRMVWPNRPAPIYDDYVLGMAAIDGQGYTIHHATGWYMNFGIAGVIIGAVLIGWIWAGLFNLLYRKAEARTWFGQILSAIGFWTFTSTIPMLLRNGPEVYKEVIMDCLLIPTALIAIAGTRLVKRYNRPCLIVARRQHAGGTSQRRVVSKAKSQESLAWREISPTDMQGAQ